MEDERDATTTAAAKCNGLPEKINGDVMGNDNGGGGSSSDDALVIDETPKKRVKAVNPYYEQSIVELSNNYKRTGSTKKPKPKLREYAQYLGLQPSVQFKCSKCNAAGFQSLQDLNQHLSDCNSIKRPPVATIAPPNHTTNFRVTRKVFLCSACCTYYENWNLFLHMREVHKRFICLYCLGMFPHAEKLSLHLLAKHQVQPTHFATPEDFYATYRQPCFLMCCECQRVFNESEDFYDHRCGSEEQQQRTVEAPDENGQCEVAEHGEEEEDTLAKERDDATSKGNSAPTSDRQPSEHQQQQCIEPTTPCESSVDQTQEESTTHHQSPPTQQQQQHPEDQQPTVSSDVTAISTTSPQECDEEEDEDGEADADEDEHETRSPAHEDDDEDEENSSLVATNDQNDAPATVTSEHDVGEIRKVPTITLKLPKITNYLINDDDEDEQSEDSDKLTMDHDHNDDEIPDAVHHDDADVAQEEHEEQEPPSSECIDVIENELANQNPPTAGVDIQINEIELEQPLDRFDIKELLRKCLQATIPTCLYCNHARKISVNGRQLGLHAIAEHRYAATVKSITAEELIPESFNTRIKECLPQLDEVYFNLESCSTSEGGVTFSHLFECFQCRFSTSVHKELYLHNRKMHTKAILLCIMCKTSFYSYSELICHLCPGIYVLDNDVRFRCCLCVSDDLPSAFRLMVHLRKKHHVCDVCLEMCHNQARLSNHVWKHKLHHLCYRCGIAYRNKPDITKHLYWKHGTESVVCKKCMQKKWPHVYHFCIPPNSFGCEECNASFTRAVCLMVHKRFHRDEFPHVCEEANCGERFVSKKLLQKHDFKHRQLVMKEEDTTTMVKDETCTTEVLCVNNVHHDDDVDNVDIKDVKVEQSECCDVVNVVDSAGDNKTLMAEVKEEEAKPATPPPPPPVKAKIDVYDLPELNLSESDSSDDSDNENVSTQKLCDATTSASNSILEEVAPLGDVLLDDATAQQATVTEEHDLENVWDNFQNYQANIKAAQQPDDTDQVETAILTDIPKAITLEEALRDHDYCPPTTDTLKEQDGAALLNNIESKEADHDYCGGGTVASKEAISIDMPTQAAGKAAKKGAAGSSSSSDSDSSSCSCGSNCSCSSSSNCSSSSSDSSESDSSSEEGRRKQQIRREKRRLKKAKSSSGTHATAGTAGETHTASHATATSTTISKMESNQIQTSSHQHSTVSASNATTAAQLLAAASRPSENMIEESDLETTESDTDEDFYDQQPQKLASKLMAEKREKLLQMAGIGPYINGSMIDSRPSTPNLVSDEVKAKKKSKSKKKKKKRRQQQQHDMEVVDVVGGGAPNSSSVNIPTVAPITLQIPKNIVPLASTASMGSAAHHHSSQMLHSGGVSANAGGASHGNALGDDSVGGNTRASKRRRVPNKFYGYSSDEDAEKASNAQPPIKFKKVEPQTVPPITIKPPPIQPISIKMSEMRVQPLRLPFPKRNSLPPTRPSKPPKFHHKASLPPPPPTLNQSSSEMDRNHDENDSDSNSSTSDDEAPSQPPMVVPPLQIHHPAPALNAASAGTNAAGVKSTKEQALYCYCRCPYDEVSEMIGCDSDDCAIEWFHFECVGIMVPPKGQWYCPDCRKKKQMKRDMMQQQHVPHNQHNHQQTSSSSS